MHIAHNSTLTIMVLYCLPIGVPVSQVPNHTIYKELQCNKEFDEILPKRALN